VRIDAALADEPQPREAFEQRRGYFGALANQDERFGVFKASRECVDVVDMVVPDFYVVAIEFAKAGECSKSVEVVVQDRDFHAAIGGAADLERFR
jgi:hypothetical protein